MKIYNELESLGFFEWLSETHNLSDTDMKPEYLDLPLNDIHRTVCNSMAFRWFRERYNLFSSETYLRGINNGKLPVIHSYSFRIFNIDNFEDFYGDEYNTYEEAELACLVKLIEIVKI